MEGGSAASGYFAIRMKSAVLTTTEYGGTRTQEKHCVRPGTFCAMSEQCRRRGLGLELLTEWFRQDVRD
ncbi:hypothetical protein [Blastococcus sp. SYSU DS1024]